MSRPPFQQYPQHIRVNLKINQYFFIITSFLHVVTTSQTYESLAILKLTAINETLDLMVEKLAEITSTEEKLANSDFSKIYDDSISLFESLNSTGSSINVTHGQVSQELLSNLTSLKNQSSVLSNRLQDIVNLTSSEQELAVKFVSRLTEAQTTITFTIEIIKDGGVNPTISTISTTVVPVSSASKKIGEIGEMYQRSGRRHEKPKSKLLRE